MPLGHTDCLKNGWLMEINLLVLDVGNSRLKIGVFKGGELTYTRRIGTDQQNDWPGTLEQAWAEIADRDNAEVAAVSSSPTLEAAVDSAAHAATGQRPQWIGIDRDIGLPTTVRTQVPAKTGVDRILNVAAAYEQLGKACCVVDAGSAVTVDFCDDSGAFLGGVIAPGAAAQARALHEVAPHLPTPALYKPDVAFGDDSESAVNAGIYHGIRGLVRAVVEQHALTLDIWPEVIATGGDAATLFADDPAGGLVHAVTPDLLFYGIAHAYAEHHIRQGT